MAPKYIDELSSIAFQCSWWMFCCLWNNSLVTIFVVTKFKWLLHFFYVVFANLQPFWIKMSLLHNLFLPMNWLQTRGVLMSKIISEGLPYIGFTYDNTLPSIWLDINFNSKLPMLPKFEMSWIEWLYNFHKLEVARLHDCVSACGIQQEPRILVNHNVNKQQSHKILCLQLNYTRCVLGSKFGLWKGVIFFEMIFRISKLLGYTCPPVFTLVTFWPNQLCMIWIVLVFSLTH